MDVDASSLHEYCLRSVRGRQILPPLPLVGLRKHAVQPGVVAAELPQYVEVFQRAVRVPNPDANLCPSIACAPVAGQ